MSVKTVCVEVRAAHRHSGRQQAWAIRRRLRVSAVSREILEYPPAAFAHSLMGPSAMRIDLDTDSEDSSPTSSTQLTTSSVNILMPGIEDYYGANKPVDIYFDVQSVGDVGITEDN